jgi:branched-chain amino acid transport system ATP-binding protein
MSLLEARTISKSFGGLSAIQELSFTVGKGEIYAVIGPNGAGKTTLFNLITGVYLLDRGEIIFEGKRVNRLKPHKIAELGISRTFQKIRLFSNLTVAQNIHIGQHCRTRAEILGGIFRGKKVKAEEQRIRERTFELLELVDLQEKRNEIAKNLSYGEQRLLEIARSMAMDPSLILLDEPSSGLNPKETDMLMERIQNINRRGITILLIEHDMNLVMGITQRLIVINFGKKIFDGTPKACRKDPEVIKAYLGEEFATC